MTLRSILVIVLAFASVGCRAQPTHSSTGTLAHGPPEHAFGPLVARAAAVPTSTTPTPAAPASDEAAMVMTDAYIEHCLNPFVSRVLQSRERYLSWVDPARGPSERADHIYGLYSVSGDPAQCATAIDTTSHLPGADPGLIELARTYQHALAMIVVNMNTIDAYFEREDWRADHMARARTVHPDLMRDWDAFADALQALHARMDPIRNAHESRELASLQNDPARRMEFLVRSGIRAARELTHRANAIELDAHHRMTGLDLATFDPAVDEYAHTIDELTAYAAAHPDEVRYTWNFGGYVDASGNMVRAFRRLADRVRQHERLSGFDLEVWGTSNGSMSQGTPDEVDDVYDHLVTAFNEVHDTREPNP